jgi:hypothetical protein
MLYWPPDFLTPPFEDAVLEALKAIYGDKESGRAYFLFSTDILVKLDFKQVDYHGCLWRRADHRGEIWAITIVDDSMVSFEILETYQEFRRDLTKLGFIHDEGDATK